MLILKMAGFLPSLVVSGQELEFALAGDRPDLIILDVTLPDMTGFEILGWLRKHPDFSTLPVILATAHGEEEDVLQGLRSGADGYVIKPFHPEALVQCVRKVLNIA